MDKCATEQEPLLLDYETGFSESDGLFNSLLLPKKYQMERLTSIERHISERKQLAKFKSSLIFEDINKYESLGPRYFDQHAEYREMAQKIECSGEDDRRQVCVHTTGHIEIVTF